MTEGVAAGRFIAPSHWQAIDLLSDLHLDAAHPRTFDAWRRQLLETPADSVWLLGDIFEVWIGDDAATHGFEQRCAEVLREATRHRHVAFMPGNRDFLVGDAFLASTGVQRLADPTLAEAFGQRLLLTHGDALCLDDQAYQRFRAAVRAPGWQAAFLARPLHERAGIARQMRDASEAGKRDQAPADWVDVDVPAALAWLGRHGAHTLVHGHTHRPGRQSLDTTRLREVLSDWDLDTTAVRGEVLRWSPAGLQRLTPEAAVAR